MDTLDVTEVAMEQVTPTRLQQCVSQAFKLPCSL
jgi:hypothetical protein